MEIDVFYKHDDLSFGFDGNGAEKNDYPFAKKGLYGFPDVDYSYASGLSAYGEGYPRPDWGQTQKEAYTRHWVGWKSSYKNDCAKLEEYISGVEKQIEADKTKRATTDDAQARVLARYIEGSQYALDELNGFYGKADCKVRKQTASDNAFKDALNAIQSGDTSGSSKTAIWLIGGSVVLLLGVLGFVVYKKMKK